MCLHIVLKLRLTHLPPYFIKHIYPIWPNMPGLCQALFITNVTILQTQILKWNLYILNAI